MRKKKKIRKMPSSLTIVMMFLVIVTVLTWVVPTSVVTEDKAGVQEIHYNAAFDDEGGIVENAGTAPKGLWNILLAVIRGFESASDVAITIFVSGGALAILNYTGALDAGIYRMLEKYTGKTLIRLLMVVFAIMGTVYGSWEELPAYAIIIIPLFVKAGYDVMTGILVVLMGATIGNMASVVNPYSVGAAVAAIGNEDLSLGSGILLRLLLFIAMYSLGSTLVVHYAERVKKDPRLSCVADIDTIKNIEANTQNDNAPSSVRPQMTPARKKSLIVFALMILLPVVGYIPWQAITCSGGKTAFDYINRFIPALSDTIIGNLLGIRGFMEFGWWYFDEFSVSWLLGALIIAIINRMSEKDFVREFALGAADLINVVLVLSAARGIALTMGTKTEGMSITFIYWIKQLLEGVPLWAFAVASICVYVLIGLFLQSTSGVAGITMPIFGAVAMALFGATATGAVGGQIVLLSAFTTGINFMCGIYPGATTMGIIEMAGVPYDHYLKQSLKILLPVLLTGALIITLAPVLHLI